MNVNKESEGTMTERESAVKNIFFRPLQRIARKDLENRDDLGSGNGKKSPNLSIAMNKRSQLYKPYNPSILLVNILYNEVIMVKLNGNTPWLTCISILIVERTLNSSSKICLQRAGPRDAGGRLAGNNLW